jgi:riboflavin biosynthesis pyrimidine reductase
VDKDLPIRPLELLYESPDLRVQELPAGLQKLYAGGLALEEPRLYANFVSTIDGVVADPALPRSNTLIAAGSDGDRFVMGLLRGYADCVLIGAGTLAGSPRGTWLPERVYPPAAAEFAELRRLRGRPPKPEVAIVTGRGSVVPDHPIFATGALVLTSAEGAPRLEGRLPPASEVVTLGADARLDPAAVLQALRERGHRLILSEAGPHTFGSLVTAGLVDDLFLTISPLLAGRRDTTYGLVESVALLPPGVRARVLSVRRHEQHLFLRYGFEHTATATEEVR